MTRTIFVVGSSSGIGLEIVRLFFLKGWNVVATCRNPESAKDLQAIQSQDTKRLLLVALELTKPETFQPAFDATIKAYGGIDALVNNAGVNVLGAFELLSQEKLRKQFEVNFFGPAQLTRLAIPYLRSSSQQSTKESLVINIGSGSGHFGLPLFSYYASSKFAFEGLTEVLHHELSHHKIAVKNIIPLGGIKGTKLGQNSFREADPLLVETIMGQKRDLSNEEPGKRELLAHHQEYGAKAMAKLVPLSDQAEGAKSAADVAQIVLEAAEDGSSKFRYFVGIEDSPLFKARYGEEDKDDEYMEKIREFFA